MLCNPFIDKLNGTAHNHRSILLHELTPEMEHVILNE